MTICPEALRKRSTQLFAVTVVLLALSVVETTRGEKSSGQFQIDLMQHHHYAKPNLSLKDRIIIAVESSRERAEYFNRKISRTSKMHSSSNSEFVYQEPVYSTQGAYDMEVQLGSPPQSKVAIADTGSDLFWLECDCIACFPEPDPAYDPAKSSSYSNASCTESLCTQLQGTCGTSGECEYSYAYGDESTTEGVLASDVLTLGSSNFTVTFGCGMQNQGTFNDTDGLVGLGRGPASIISQIGSSFGNVFSYCLVSFYDSPSKTSPLYFGNADKNASYYTYTPLGSDTTYYDVNLNGILVNGDPLIIPPGTFSSGFIFDSGTTVTQLQEDGYTPLLSTVQSLINYTPVDGSSFGLDACYSPDVSTPSWPQVTFQFQNVNVTLPDDNLFLQIETGVYCMIVQGSSVSLGIFGNVQQQNFDIQYDVGNSQIGISGPTRC